MVVSGSGAAEDVAGIVTRVGNHPRFGRVVFDLPAGTLYRLVQDGDRVILHFEPAVPVGAASAMPRNVHAITGGAGQVELVLDAGATIQSTRLGDRVVVDALDPAGVTPAGGQSTPSRPTPAQASLPPARSQTSAGAAVRGTGKAGAAPVASQPATGPAAAAPAATNSPTATPAATNRPAAGATGQPQVGRASGAEASGAATSDHPLPSHEPAPRAGPAAQAASPASQAVAPRPSPHATEGSGPPGRSPAATQPAPDAAAPVNPPGAVTEEADAAAAAHGASAPAAAALADPHRSDIVTGANDAMIDSQVAAPTAPPAETVRASAVTGAVAPPGERDPILTPSSNTGSGPVALVVRPAVPPLGTQGTAFSVPFEPNVAAAAFRHGGTDYAVFAARRPLDMSLLRGNRLLGRATVQVLPAATLIRLRLAPGMSLQLEQTRLGWTVAAVTAAASPQPMAASFADGRLTLAADAPGDVVAISDPESGATLLVGTQHRSGQGVAIRRHGAEFTLLPTWQGVLVEALSDHLALRTVADGFALTAEPGGLAISPMAAALLADSASLTRRFVFPPMPEAALRERLAIQVASSAAAPPLSRGPRRRAAAVDMIALGMGAEAESLLKVTAEQDPQEAASATTIGLTAIAALLADRPEDAVGLTDARLTGSDEVAFWRAVRSAEIDDASPQAAASFAVTTPLALGYPAGMRDRVLPLAVETMLRGGQQEAADAVLARARDLPGLDLARAMSRDVAGDTEAALKQYDALAKSRDQLDYARASERALELRLKTNQITPQQAADGMDRLLYAWRGDRHDLRVRERLAELRQQSGQWRAALAALRNAEQDFPEAKTEIHGRLQASFAALLHDDAADRLPPLDLVALVDENTDLLPVSVEGEAMQSRLADRLLALDLPRRAEPVLEKLMRAAPTQASRAGFGARLAALRLREGNAAGALTALTASAGSELPSGLIERRQLLYAGATARRGDYAAAMAAIADLDSAAAGLSRADIMEQAQDWPGAERALADYVAKAVPETGALTDPQRQALLRLATAAARAGDDTALSGMKVRDTARMGSGPLADMFRLLTADPILGTADLQRSRQEVGMARAVPAGLKALQPCAALP